MTATPAFVGGPTGPARAAPGPGGYVLAVVVADLVASLLLGIFVFTDPATPVVAGVIIVLPFVCVLSIPFGAAGVVLVHLLCRSSERQSVHVLAAGVAGLLAAAAADAAVFGGRAYALYVVVPVATALGRAALAPAVRRRSAAADWAYAAPLG